MGSTRPLDAFTFFFRETEHGIFIAHCYQYEPGRSTWVMETDPETFARAGLDTTRRGAVGAIPRRRVRQGARRPQADHQPLALAQLPDHPLRDAGPHDNIVLIGDAKATAHFSIGSGTKLAMEDAIALYEAFRATGGRDVKRALARFETERRVEVEKTQHSADVSLVWFEHVRRFWDMDPTRFAFGLMTRSQGDHLRQSARCARRSSSREIDKAGARATCAGRASTSMSSKPAVPMFQPFRLRGMTLEQSRRRLADGPVFGGRRHADRLASRASRLAARSAAPG